MKKILLFAALVASAFAAQAAKGFTAVDKHTGNVINDGDVVYAVWEDEFIEQYAAQVAVNSVTDEKLMMILKAEVEEALPANFSNQFCWESCYSPSAFPWEQNFTAPEEGVAFGNIWRLDVMGATAEQRERNYTIKFTLINVEDEEDTLHFDLVLGDESGVEAIEADNAAAEYFTIDGRRVNNPEEGLYIVRRGNKTGKIVLRK